jgi:hypothetical protein
MATDPNAIGQQGRVPYNWQGTNLAPGFKPHLPVTMGQPGYFAWLHGGRKQRASAYAEALQSVGVDYAPVSTFARVQRPLPIGGNGRSWPQDRAG